ncbi:MAG: YceI family protein [Gemmatimonadota bacterium]
MRSFHCVACALAGLCLLVASGYAPALWAPAVEPVVYQIDPEHSTVQFKVRHLGLATVTGQFNRFAGTFSYDPARPAATTVTATIDVASVDTDNERRDTHLRSEDFFFADSFPTITFASRRVVKTGDEDFAVHGDLTIRGVTRPVVLEVELVGTGRTGGGAVAIGFEAETEINRKDYGLVWNRAIETGGWLVGDDIRILLEIEATGS